MSNFKALLDVFGLSVEEAATYLQVEPSDVILWCQPEKSPPIDVWQKMVELFDTIRFAAEDAAKAADLDRMTATDLNSLNFLTGLREGTGGAPLGTQKIIAAMATASLARVFV